MTGVDVIILSYCKTAKEYQMTKECVRTLRNSEVNFKFNVVIVESNSEILNAQFVDRVLFDDNEVRVLAVKGKFNYNKYLQVGYSHLTVENKFLLIINNDLLFKKGWLTEIFKHIKEADSFSAFCPEFHAKRHKVDTTQPVLVGHKLWNNLTGWLIFIKKHIFEVAKFEEYFPEVFDFYFQDNYYLEMLKFHGFKQALVTNSHVRHLGSQSHGLIHHTEYFKMTDGSRKKFEEMKTKLIANS